MFRSRRLSVVGTGAALDIGGKYTLVQDTAEVHAGVAGMLAAY